MLKTGAVLEARRARLLFCTRVMAKRAMMTAAAMAIPEKRRAPHHPSQEK